MNDSMQFSRFSSLKLPAMKFHIHLGVGDLERQDRQEVHFEIEVRFCEALKAEFTDLHSDCYCYGELFSFLKEKIENKSFHLIEYLARQTYIQIKNWFRNHNLSTHKENKDVSLRVVVHKLKTPISELVSGSIYTVGDF